MEALAASKLVLVAWVLVPCIFFNAFFLKFLIKHTSLRKLEFSSLRN